MRLNFSVEDTCTWCQETIEDSYHFRCECPALFHRRFNKLGSYFVQNLSEIVRTNPCFLIDFMDQAKRTIMKGNEKLQR